MATEPATRNGKANRESLDTRELLKTLTAVKKGDFSMRLPVEQTGTVGKIYDTLNDIFDLLEGGTKEFVRIWHCRRQRRKDDGARHDFRARRARG